jgi:ArsR family transcriptional regulator, arsenate/arsenite/antimonite-responsive transcriptional repressor
MRKSAYKELRMDEVLTLMNALSEPTRLAALKIVWDGEEHCVCKLMETLSATQSRMSRHMSVLKAAGLVIDRRDAQWVRYRRNPALAPALTRIVEAVLAAIADEPRRAA